MAGRSHGSVHARSFIRLYETNSANGNEYITIAAPAALSANYAITLPTTAGSNLQFLQTDGSGVLSWANVSSSAITHTSLSSLNGGTYTDGGHTNLALLHTSTAVPIATDDISAYKLGTIWIDVSVSNGQLYICSDNTSTAAVWRNLLYALGNIQAAAGTVSLPSIYLSTDTTSGIYRIGSNNLGVAISGAKVLDISSSGLGLTGTLAASAGTVSLPSIYLSTDTTSGIYRIGSNNLGVAISGAKVLDISSSGLELTGTLAASAGTVSLPSIYLSTDTTSGIYRIGSNNLGVAISGVKIIDIASTGSTFTGKVIVSGGTDPGFIAPNGTLGLPAYRFTNNSNSGIYSIASNNLGIVINGSTLLDLSTIGLGVGQAAAAEKLEVNGNVKATYFKMANTNAVLATGTSAPNANHVIIGSAAAATLGVASSDGVYIGAGVSTTVVADTGSVIIGKDAAYSFSAVTARKVIIGKTAGYYGTDLSGSTIIGDQAAYGVTTTTGGTYNTIVGYKTGFSITTASYNTLMGTYAGYNISTGDTNVCIGREAGGAIAGTTGITTGAENVAIGKLAMATSTGVTGNQNVAIGVEAGSMITTGYENICLGYQAGGVAANSTGIKTGGENIAIGSYALSAGADASGLWNIAIGRSTCESMTTGNRNIAIGMGAISTGATGTYNVCLGISAGDKVTGDFNIGIGLGALGTGVVTGTNNIAIGQTAGANFTSAGYNIAIGEDALSGFPTVNTGVDNIALGRRVARFVTSGTYNLALGASAADALSSGIGNQLIGYQAGKAITTENYNICLGYQAAVGITSADNIAIGRATMAGVGSGAGCVCVGYNAGNAVSSAANCVFVGYGAGATVTSGTKNIGIGSGALGTGTITGANNIAIGENTGAKMTSATQNVAIGSSALYDSGTTNTGTYINAIGYLAGSKITTGSYNDFIGRNAGLICTTNQYNVAVGNNALGNVNGAPTYTSTNGYHNVAIGSEALGNGITTAKENVAMGSFAGRIITTGVANILIGLSAGTNMVNAGSGLGTKGLKTAFRCIAIGTEALGYGVDSSGSDNTAIGYSSLWQITSGAGNIGIGAIAGSRISTGNNNIAIGSNSLYGIGDVSTTGGFSGNIAIGASSLGATTYTAGNTGSYNTGIGIYGGVSITSGSFNNCLGYKAGYGITTGTNNIAVGSSALGNETPAITGIYNVAVGDFSLVAATGAVGGNTSIGSHAGKILTTGANNVILGYSAGTDMLNGLGTRGIKTTNYSIAIGAEAMGFGVDASGTGNIALGYSSLWQVTSGAYNIALGFVAGSRISTGSYNVAIGHESMYSIGDISASGGVANNVAIGHNALRNVTRTTGTAGCYNTAIGNDVGSGITTGESNTLVGASAYVLAGTTGACVALGAVAHASSNCIAIGYNAAATSAGADPSISIGKQTVASGSGTIVIGNDLSASTADHAFIGRSAAYIYCNYTVNATWTYASDISIKQDITPIQNTLGLDFIKKLKPVMFKFKPETRRDNNRHMGFIAQDVKAAMNEVQLEYFDGHGEMNGLQHVGQTAFIPSMVQSIQELSNKLDAALARISTLEAAIVALG